MTGVRGFVVLGMSNYYVVTLERGDPLAERAEFHHRGSDLVEAGVGRLRARMLRTGDHSVPPGLEYAEVYSFGEVAPGYEHLVPERMRVHMPPEEYERFAKVYFLNEAAFQMYKEGGVDFEVAKVIPEDELPRGCTCNLKGPYIPEEE